MEDKKLSPDKAREIWANEFKSEHTSLPKGKTRNDPTKDAFWERLVNYRTDTGEVFSVNMMGTIMGVKRPTVYHYINKLRG